MSVRITDNHPRIAIQMRRNASLFLRMFAEAVQRTAEPNTPRDTGMLRRSVQIQVLGLHGIIRWQKIYAIYQEIGYGRGPIRKYTTAGTGPHFAENAIRSQVANSYAIARKAGLL